MNLFYLRNYYNCLNCFILHKYFGKNDSFITSYIVTGALPSLQNFANIIIQFKFLEAKMDCALMDDIQFNLQKCLIMKGEAKMGL